MEDLECDDIKIFSELLKAPEIIQDPVWTRWTATIKAATLGIERWTFIYFTMIAVKSSK